MEKRYNPEKYELKKNEINEMNQESLISEILDERARELAFEGHRWFDLIRIDGGDYALKFFNSIGKVNATKDRMLLPIPQVEMDANALMVQNPGY